METGEISESFWGDKLYQQRAREALPLLVRQALVGEKILYSQLADEMNMPNARNLNYVLGCIGSTLIELGEAHDIDIPPIQCLVVNKTTGLPGEGVGWFISDSDFRKLNKKQKKVVVDSQLAKIYAFPDWLRILKLLGLRKPDFPSLPKQKPRKVGGESQNHKALKEYIAKNPLVIGLSDSWPIGEIEFDLPSGDSVDVMFSWRKQMVAVEVKSRISDVADVGRGLFQCVKYQSVTEAMLSVQGLPQNVRTVLVLESKCPPSLKTMQHILGIEIIDEIQPL
ncbi:hypothetical protein ABMY44_04855 [Pseudoalteromonas sp. Cnat2-41]|uniref:hypothetical protein n=1 Tax=unclassified Pseudoalteromonas TaxID=194690 RepID=UPI001EF9A153|nr:MULTISPECIES: hypothetical protein [unclassified Pseudoalteromonas]MCF2861486.1 hypothetical protein [Pseudoalteromonas sp. CNAT2-18]MCG7557475.1 hypothetical protein [Pseudoalteromonas sp. CNAT2-18.1]